MASLRVPTRRCGWRPAMTRPRTSSAVMNCVLTPLPMRSKCRSGFCRRLQSSQECSFRGLTLFEAAFGYWRSERSLWEGPVDSWDPSIDPLRGYFGPTSVVAPLREGERLREWISPILAAPACKSPDFV
jgi:hypothetical protein